MSKLLHYACAIKSCEIDYNAILSGDAAQAIVYCQKVCSLAPDFSWGYRTLGYIQQRSLKDNAAAEKSYEKALAICPDCKEVRDLLTDLHVARSDFDGALDIANNAVKVNPHDSNNFTACHKFTRNNGVCAKPISNWINRSD
jgi:tetratricopeptide (TPR) repeat protein